MDELVSLQQAADYWTYKAALRKISATARGSAIGGTILLFLGIVTLHLSPINGVLVFLGLFLLVEGIWLARSPTLAGLLVDGVALLAVGAWNVVITCVGPTLIAPPFFTFFGICQIVWGIKSIIRYKRLSSTIALQPSPEAAQQMEDMVASIAALNPDTDEDVITFRELNSPNNRYWKAKLADGMGVFVLGKGEDVIVAGKDQVSIKRGGKLVNDTCKLGQRKMRGYISPELFKRYEAWAGTGAAK